MRHPVAAMVSFLDNKQMPRHTRARLRPHMANWLTAHAHIADMEHKVETLQGKRAMVQEIGYMLMIELTDRPLHPRFSLLERLHAKLNKWRMLQEQEEIDLWLKGQKKTLSSGT